MLIFQLKLWLSLIVLSIGAVCSADGEHPLHIKLPNDLDPQKATVQVFQVNGGNPADWSKETGFTSKVDSAANVVRVLVYYPGYKIATLEYSKENMQDEKIFEPEMIKLPLIPVSIKIVDSSGKPMAGHKINIRRNPVYLNCFDKCAVQLEAVPAFTAETGNDGIACGQLPNLFDDRLFIKFSRGNIHYSVFAENWEGEGFGYSLDNMYFDAKKEYPEPLVFTKIFNGKLQTTVQDSFLEKHGLIRTSDGFKEKATGAKRILEFWAHRGGSGNGQQVPESYHQIIFLLRPGSYVLSMQILDESKKPLQKIVLEENVLIREKEKKEYVVK